MEFTSLVSCSLHTYLSHLSLDINYGYWEVAKVTCYNNDMISSFTIWLLGVIVLKATTKNILVLAHKSNSHHKEMPENQSFTNYTSRTPGTLQKVQINKLLTVKKSTN